MMDFRTKNAPDEDLSTSVAEMSVKLGERPISLYLSGSYVLQPGALHCRGHKSGYGWTDFEDTYSDMVAPGALLNRYIAA
jgi:hypothetical protein